MRVIVSNKIKTSFKNYTVVESLGQLDEMDLSQVKLVILHEFEEIDFDAGVYITDFYKKGITQFIYINKNPSITINMVISGIKGHTYTDEFYLEDEEELDLLIEDIRNISEDSEEDNSAYIVSDFIQRFARGEESIKAPVYLDQVRTAVAELNKTIDQKDYQISAMGESAIDVFYTASEALRSISKKREDLEVQVNKLKKALMEESDSTTQRAPLANNIQYFTQVNYMRTPKLLLVRELTPCRYLTTFLLMYSIYLHYSLNKRVKYVILHQSSFSEFNRYANGNFGRIGMETMDTASIYDKDMLTVSAPFKGVLNRIFDSQVDIFIFLDRMYQNKEMVGGKRTLLNAVGGLNNIKAFGLNPKDTITCVRTTNECFANMRTIGDYPDDFGKRQGIYMQMYGSTFKKFDELLGF